MQMRLCKTRTVDRLAFSGLLSDTHMADSQISFVMRLSRRIALLLLLLSVPAWALKSVPVWAVKAVPDQSSMARSQKHQSRRTIDQLEETWRKAVLTSNTAVIETLLADDYIAISAIGTLQTKEQTLASIRSGKMRISSIEISDRKVRFYGATALVTSRAETVGTTEDGDISGSYLYTRVYVRDKRGVWKIVSFEVNLIRGSGERK
jgi:ketosteroid isomerase-like protein